MSGKGIAGSSPLLAATVPVVGQRVGGVDDKRGQSRVAGKHSAQ